MKLSDSTPEPSTITPTRTPSAESCSPTMSTTSTTTSAPTTTSRPARKITAGQVAELFGVRVETVRRWADDGKLRCTRTLGGDRRFDEQYVQQLLADQ